MLNFRRIYEIKRDILGCRISRYQRFSSFINSLFEEFTQADPTTTRKYGGTGLGLALSKRICELLGGQISVVSQLNKGTKFTICLPIKSKLKSRLNNQQSSEFQEDDSLDIKKAQ